jgi:hypothetical protein
VQPTGDRKNYREILPKLQGPRRGVILPVRLALGPGYLTGPVNVV